MQGEEKSHKPETHKGTRRENRPENNTPAKAKSVKKKNSDSFKWWRGSLNCLSGTSVLLMHTGPGKTRCQYLRHTIKESQFPTWALKKQAPNINIYAEIRTQKENLKQKILGAHTHTPYHTQKKKFEMQEWKENPSEHTSLVSDEHVMQLANIYSEYS